MKKRYNIIPFNPKKYDSKKLDRVNNEYLEYIYAEEDYNERENEKIREKNFYIFKNETYDPVAKFEAGLKCMEYDDLINWYYDMFTDDEIEVINEVRQDWAVSYLCNTWVMGLDKKVVRNHQKILEAIPGYFIDNSSRKRSFITEEMNQ